MSYDPSHRKPPRQERWPSATPAEGWPAYRDGGASRDHEADGRYGADRLGAYQATRQQAGYQRASGGSGDRGYQWSAATGPFPPTTNPYGGGDGYGSAAGGYSGYGYQTGGYSAGGYPGAGNGYAGAGNGYAAPVDGYAGEFDGVADGYDWDDDGYRVPADGYDWDDDGYRVPADGYGAQLGPGSYMEYAEPVTAGPRLTPPDVGIHPDSWHADRDSRRRTTQRGMLVGAVTEVLSIAVAIGVSTLAAALFRAQASPAAAMGGVFIDRMPAGLRNAVIQHFGASGRHVLLLGMFAAVAFIALVIGVLARRAAALAVAGVAAFTLFAAFAAVTRPAAGVSDVMPAVVGGIAGVAALLWLVHAAAPITPPRHSHASTRRRAR